MSASTTRRTTTRRSSPRSARRSRSAARSGERTVPADEFFVGVYLTAVGEGELLTKVSVPTRKPGTGDAMEGVTLGAHGTYIANAAATVGPDGVRVAVGCVAAVPVRATAMEERLATGDFSEASVRAAAEGLGASLDPPADVHASADYRRHLAEVSAVRAVAPGRRESERMSVPTSTSRTITVDVNGKTVEHDVPASMLLVHFLRDELDLTGTHVGCDTGSCGACTVHVDGDAVKSCCLLAVQVDGSKVTTIEALAGDDGELTPLQQAFHEHHGLQCGYCTPGMLMSATALLERNPRPTEEDVKVALQGNICRCTGYWNIVEAVVAAGEGSGR